MSGPTSPPDPPYYAVIFSSRLTGEDIDGYHAMAERMFELAPTLPGYLGAETARGKDGAGITVCYWRDEAAINNWREHGEHKLAQEKGIATWYDSYELKIAKVERAYGFKKD